MLAAGIPEALYWRSTPRELCALLEQIAARRKAETREAAMRAGLIAASIFNVQRPRGARILQPSDFVNDEPEIVSPAEAARRIAAWGFGKQRKRLPPGRA